MGHLSCKLSMRYAVLEGYWLSFPFSGEFRGGGGGGFDCSPRVFTDHSTVKIVPPFKILDLPLPPYSPDY